MGEEERAQRSEPKKQRSTTTVVLHTKHTTFSGKKAAGREGTETSDHKDHGGASCSLEEGTKRGHNYGTSYAPGRMLSKKENKNPVFTRHTKIFQDLSCLFQIGCNQSVRWC